MPRVREVSARHFGVELLVSRCTLNRFKCTPGSDSASPGYAVPGLDLNLNVGLYFPGAVCRLAAARHSMSQLGMRIGSANTVGADSGCGGHDIKTLAEGLESEAQVEWL